jgi:hypothetical protein
MNKKTYIFLLSIISMLVVSTVNVSAYDGTLTITDETGDVEKTDEAGNVTPNNIYPDIDLKTLSFKQNGKQVDVTMKLADGGVFQEDLLTFYVIVLITTSPNGEYDIFYSGGLAIEAGSPLIVLSNADEEGIESIDDYTGKGTDTLQFSFDLMDKNERLLSVLIMNTKDDYVDVYPQNIEDIGDINEVTDIQINAGGTYNITTGKSLQLSGAVVSGEITNDHEWFWTFDDSSITLEGKNPTYTFNTPDNYTGTLYVYDGKGSWGLDNFEVIVTGASTNGGNNNNNQPGFELILVIAAVAITLLIFRKKKK